VRFEDNLQDPAEATQLAKVRGELLAAQQMTFRGHGHVLGFHPGLCFTLQEHPRDDFNAGYQITRVRHRASRLDLERHVLRQLGIPLAREGYEVEIEALPEGVQFRPERRAPWPRVPGLESALVDGGADSPYAQVDDDGRYRARLLFDEAKSPAGAATAWLRMLQPHGGAPEASHFPLRKGTEVLVAFVHGDPDRPYILGAAPTPTTPSPVTKANQTQNVIQTGAKNRIEIEDTEGQQYIDVSSPNQKSFMHLGVHAGLGDHNLVVSSVGDGLHNAVGNRDITVGGNQTEDVTGDLVEEYSSNQATHVSGSFTETVDSGKTQTISAGSTQSIDGGLTQTVSGGETRTVNGAVGESISGGRTQTIHGATTESISGSLGQTVTGAVSISTPATYQLSASAGITMMTPASGTLKGTGGVTLIAPGSQTTVDSEFRKIGFDHGVQYCVRGTYGSFTMTAAALCSRNLGMHYQAFGLKFDIKAYDNKNVATDDKYGALSLIPSPVETKGAAVHQIDTTPEASSDTGPSTGSPPGAPGAPGAPPEAPPVGPPEAPPPAAPPEFPPEVPPNPPPAAPPEPPPAAPPEPPPPAAPPEAPPGATDPAGGGAP
jgi:type VI secretion system secreted protein VgrG